MSYDSDVEPDETPEDSPLGGTGGVEDHHAFILGYRSADVDLRSCQPLPSHIPFLWSVFQENVDPLVKILHAPTADALMRDARRSPDSLTPGNECLVFAICFSAVVSLEPEEVRDHFNVERDELLRQFRFALEQALARANFLYTSELVVLQAFTMFLIVVRTVDDSRFCWTLTGLLIRIAQGMGLHRDGAQFDLTPYEVEMRRRLWWAILVLDLRSAEEVGSDLTVTEQSFDTKLPSNINDADISPTSIEVPTPREGRSDMAVVIARYEILLLSRRFLTELPQKDAGFCPGDREKLLVEAYQRVEDRFLKYAVDERDSLYWLVSIVARIIVAKMCLNLYQTKIFPGEDTDISDESRDRIFVAAIEVVELGTKLNTDPRCRQYRWLFRTYTNWHAIAFNLIELCRRPWNALVERSWEAIRVYDRDPVDVQKAGDHAAIFLPLRKLYARARKHRDAEILRLRSSPDEARRMDWQERVNPAAARFGPVPGDEGKMEEVRSTWWSLVRPGGPPPSVADTMDPLAATASGKTAPGFINNGAANPMSPSTTVRSAPSTGPSGPAEPMQFSDQTMEMLDDIMAQPNLNMSSFWPINISGFSDKGLNMAMDGTNPTTDTQGQQTGNGDALRQQAMALHRQAASQDSHPPPWLWSHGWGDSGQQAGHAQTPVDNSGSADLDMLEGDFDWRGWGNTLAAFDMSGMPPPAPL